MTAASLDELGALLAPRADHRGDRVVVMGVAAAAMVATGLLLWRYGAGLEAIAYSVAVAGLVPLVVIDLRHHRLPREITYATTAVCGVLLAIDAHGGDDTTARLAAMLLGVVIYVGALGVISLATGRSVGAGDVRLGVLVGIVVGYRAAARAGWGLAAGFAIAAVAGVVLLAARRIERRASIPFGPFLAVGAVAVLVVDGP